MSWKKGESWKFHPVTDDNPLWGPTMLRLQKRSRRLDDLQREMRCSIKSWFSKNAANFSQLLIRPSAATIYWSRKGWEKKQGLDRTQPDLEREGRKDFFFRKWRPEWKRHHSDNCGTMGKSFSVNWIRTQSRKIRKGQCEIDKDVADFNKNKEQISWPKCDRQKSTSSK